MRWDFYFLPYNVCVSVFFSFLVPVESSRAAWLLEGMDAPSAAKQIDFQLMVTCLTMPCPLGELLLIHATTCQALIKRHWSWGHWRQDLVRQILQFVSAHKFPNPLIDPVALRTCLSNLRIYKSQLNLKQLRSQWTCTALRVFLGQTFAWLWPTVSIVICLY